MKKKFLGVFIAAVLLLGASGCSQPGKVSVSGGITMIKENSSSYILDNGKIYVAVDKETGAVVTLKNLTTGAIHKNPDGGAWPFALETGENRDDASIKTGGNNKPDGIALLNKDGRDYLNFTYNDIKTDARTPRSTGIRAVSHISLGADDEYIKLSVDLDMTSAKDTVKALTFVKGGALRSGAADPADERMTAPTWGGGAYWKRPADNKYFNDGGIVLGYPGMDTHSLEAGWIDVHGPSSGVGVGIISKSELYSEFAVESEGQTGMSISPRLFYPSSLGVLDLELEKGVKFQSDEVIVAAHSGDWHTMADIYRAEYQQAFVLADGSPDYLTEATISEKLKGYDYILRGGAGQDGQLLSTFPQMLSSFNSFTAATGAEP
jgi:hypothetical protein